MVYNTKNSKNTKKTKQSPRSYPRKSTHLFAMLAKRNFSFRARKLEKGKQSASFSSKTTGKKTGDDATEVHRAKIRLIGVGGGGGNIVAEIASRVPRVDFWAANTDIHALKRIGKRCRHFIFGQNLTHGLGCGGDAKIGTAAARQAEEKIERLFKDVDLCILVSCLGGGTGSGAVTEFARLAKKENCLTLGVFTLPFRFEGEKRMQTARAALAKTIPILSASIVFPNEKIFQLLDRGSGFHSSLSAVNTILANDLKNLMDVIYSPGMINIDFADIRSVLEGEGNFAYLASVTVHEGGSSSGDAVSARGENSLRNRADIAVKTLLSHPLNEYNPKGAERILLNIAADRQLSVEEVKAISDAVCALNPYAKMIFGIAEPPHVKNTIIVTLLAVGKPEKMLKKRKEKKVFRVRSVSAHTRQQIQEEQDQEKMPFNNKHPRSTKIPVEHQKESSPPHLEKTSFPSVSSRIPRKHKKIERGKEEKKQKVQRKKTESRHRHSGDHMRRKNALDLQREIELAAKQQQEEEKRWDIPAFLRRNPT